MIKYFQLGLGLQRLKRDQLFSSYHILLTLLYFQPISNPHASEALEKDRERAWGNSLAWARPGSKIRTEGCCLVQSVISDSSALILTVNMVREQENVDSASSITPAGQTIVTCDTCLPSWISDLPAFRVCLFALFYFICSVQSCHGYSLVCPVLQLSALHL